MSNEERLANRGSACASAEQPSSHNLAEPKLGDLIPIALVIAAGCESCAEKMVARALQQGSSWQHVQQALGVVAHMQKLDCFAQAVGPEVVARMEKPLASARRTLRQAMTAAQEASTCQCAGSA